jgi:hypothetical protein
LLLQFSKWFVAGLTGELWQVEHLPLTASMANHSAVSHETSQFDEFTAAIAGRLTCSSALGAPALMRGTQIAPSKEKK